MKKPPWNQSKGACKDGRGGRIRTYDFLLPKQARYQAALHPEHPLAIAVVSLRQDPLVAFGCALHAGREPSLLDATPNEISPV